MMMLSEVFLFTFSFCPPPAPPPPPPPNDLESLTMGLTSCKLGYRTASGRAVADLLRGGAPIISKGRQEFQGGAKNLLIY